MSKKVKVWWSWNKRKRRKEKSEFVEGISFVTMKVIGITTASINNNS